MNESLDRIRYAVGEGGLKKSNLAKEAGLRLEVLTGIDSTDWNPRTKTVQALIEALDRIASRLAA